MTIEQAAKVLCHVANRRMESGCPNYENVQWMAKQACDRCANAPAPASQASSDPAETTKMLFDAGIHR